MECFNRKDFATKPVPLKRSDIQPKLPCGYSFKPFTMRVNCTGCSVENRSIHTSIVSLDSNSTSFEWSKIYYLVLIHRSASMHFQMQPCGLHPCEGLITGRIVNNSANICEYKYPEVQKFIEYILRKQKFRAFQSQTTVTSHALSIRSNQFFGQKWLSSALNHVTPCRAVVKRPCDGQQPAEIVQGRRIVYAN